MKIAIAGRQTGTANYEKYIRDGGAVPVVTLEDGAIAACDALLLPGGGDITPAFFGEQNHGSRDIDTALDILQIQAFRTALERGLPVLGICKGMQIINVGLGGTILQDLDAASRARHRYDHGDQYHSSAIEPGSWLYPLYGAHTLVNSAHHQALGRLGQGLTAVQRCPADGCVEGISHQTLPILGVQWHPERIEERESGTPGSRIRDHFFRLAQA